MAYRSLQDFDSGDLETGSRICVKCNARKYMTEFHWSAGKKWRVRSCKECGKLADRARRQVGKSTKSRADTLRLTYGISEATYDALAASRKGCCWICGCLPTKKLHVDHNHETGEVRGLLCAHCNKGLGHYYDNPEALRTAASYLEAGPADIEYIPKHKTKEEISAARSKAVHEYVKATPYAYSKRAMGGGNKLTQETVQAIIDMYATGNYTQYDVATHFGISQCTVSDKIRKSKTKENA